MRVQEWVRLREITILILRSYRVPLKVRPPYKGCLIITSFSRWSVARCCCLCCFAASLCMGLWFGWGKPRPPPAPGNAITASSWITYAAGGLQRAVWLEILKTLCTCHPCCVFEFCLSQSQKLQGHFVAEVQFWWGTVSMNSGEIPAQSPNRMFSCSGEEADVDVSNLLNVPWIVLYCISIISGLKSSLDLPQAFLPFWDMVLLYAAKASFATFRKTVNEA